MDLKKTAFIDAYIKSFGNITQSCTAAGISRGTYYNWIAEDAEFKKAVDNAEPAEVFVDFAENALIKRIQAEDTTAIIFALKTKGKKRGYVERQEITGADGKGFEVKIQPSPGCEPMKDEGTPDNIHSSL